jgi:sterol desaturase/sphingolipid hydroxylase (fatty acid hydroxylase superfamily)
LPDIETYYYASVIASVIAAFWWESLSPLDKRDGDIAHVAGNLVLWGLAYLIGDILVGQLWLDIYNYVNLHPFGLFYQLELPWPWLLVAIGLIVIDFLDYLFHRLSHAIPLLWRLHSVHHTDQLLDVSTTLRIHPLDLILTTAWKLSCAFLLGLPLWMIALRELLIAPLVYFQHANVKLPSNFERGLGRILVTPVIHRHHHSRLRNQHDSNYGEGLILWDKLFGSYQEPPAAKPADYGVAGFTDAKHQTVMGMLVTPFLSPTKEQLTSGD